MKNLRQENIHSDIFTPRAYQVALLDTALLRNTIVCLGTGTGKTFIAVMLIKELSHEVTLPFKQNGKRTIFLVNTVPLVQQQAKAVRLHSDLSVGEYFGELNVDTWTAREWEAEFLKHQVLVMTAQVFVDILHHGFLKLGSVNLIVFDECHHATKNHPYVQIMRCFDSCARENQPRVLGLTASIINRKIKCPIELEQQLTNLEQVLKSRAETSADAANVEQYGTKPKEHVIECEEYEDKSGLVDEISSILDAALTFIQESNITCDADKGEKDPLSIPKTVMLECQNILHTLGPWCASKVAQIFMKQLTKLVEHEVLEMPRLLMNYAFTQLNMIQHIVDETYDTRIQTLEDFLTLMSPKVLRLVDVLREFKPDDDFVILGGDDFMMEGKSSYDEGDDGEEEEDDDDSLIFSDEEEEEDDLDDKSSNRQPKSSRSLGSNYVAVKTASTNQAGAEDESLCGLIFVERRHTAFALNKLIVELCNWDPDLYFVHSHHITGHSSGPSNSPAKDREMLYKKQEDVLKKFRQRELNLLISTSVLEEGVDVPRCNLVLRFDLPVDYRAYVQSKGRARAASSKYYMLVNQANFDSFSAELKTFKGIEKILTSKSQAQGVDVGEEAEEVGGNSGELIPPYMTGTEEGAPRVTINSAISLVNRYCAKLPSDAFTHLTPRCKVDVVSSGVGSCLYKAVLQLPINSPIKQPIESDVFPSKKLSRQAVALKACEVLHRAGELDDHLLPVGKETIKYEDEEKEWEEREVEGQARPGTTKRKQYYQKRVAASLLGRPLPNTKCYLYIFSMTLTCPITEEQNTRGRKIHAPDDTPTGFGFISEKEIPFVPNFPVFTRSGEVTTSIDLVKAGMTFSDEELETMLHFHRFLFVRVLRLEKDPMVFNPSAADSSCIIVPLVKNGNDIDVNWAFLKKISDVPLRATKRKYMFKTDEDKFAFNPEDFADAVVMPSYRNIDQPQYFYVAEIRDDLNPRSSFPSPELYDTFEHYYTSKYGLKITNPKQPLLDVDHTSARLNLLTPRYMNQKGVALPTSSAETRRARRENLQQKQILIPELCEIHPFPASLWRKAVCIPAILYRMNYLLVADEIRILIATQACIGRPQLPLDFRFPELEFGFSTKPGEGKMWTSGDEKTEKRQVARNQTGSALQKKPGYETGRGTNLERVPTAEESKISADFSADSSKMSIPKGSPQLPEHHSGESRDNQTSSVEDHTSIPEDRAAIADSAKTTDRLDTAVEETEEQEAESDDEYYDACSSVSSSDVTASAHSVCMSEQQDEETFTSLDLVMCECETPSVKETQFLDEPTAKSNALCDTENCQQESNLQAVCEEVCQLTITDNNIIPHVKEGSPAYSSDVDDEVSCCSVNKQPASSDSEATPDEEASPSRSDEEQYAINIRFDEDVNLAEFVGPSPCLILQTLTMSNANDFFNLERLETIGDSFLKFAITVYLYCEYPGIHEGKLSYLRSKQVSNYNLYKLGKKKEFPDCMVAVKFEPTENWLPPGYVIHREGAYKGLSVHIASKIHPPSTTCDTSDSGAKEKSTIPDVTSNGDCDTRNISATTDSSDGSRTQQIKFAKELEECTKNEEKPAGGTVVTSLMPYNLQTQHSLPDKSIADCVEALIGCYLTTCGQKAALQFMSWLGLKVLPENKCSTSKDKDVSSNNGRKHRNHCSLQPPPSPLLTHVPHAQKVLRHYLSGYDAFERKICYNFRDKSYLLQAFTHASYHYNTVTDCYQRLEFLGDAILDYVITRHLFEDSKKHSPGILTDLRSALVNNNIFAALAVKWDFHKYFKAISPQLFHVIDKFVTWQKDRNDEINLDEEFEEDEDDTDGTDGKEREDIEIPKALGDIFESVAGAVYLDSGMSLDTVWRVYYRMMKPQIDAFTETIPKSPVRELLEMEPETAKFEKPERTMDGKIRVTVNVVGKGNFRGIGRNYRIAKSAAAKRALKHIKLLQQLIASGHVELEIPDQ